MNRAELMATAVGKADRDATLLFIRHAGASQRARRRIAAKILTESVYAQARILGVVRCGRCGDRGCDWCSR